MEDEDLLLVFFLSTNHSPMIGKLFCPFGCKAVDFHLFQDKYL